MGLARWHRDKEPACQCRRLRRRGFSPWVGKIPWRRKSQPTPVFLSEKSHEQRSLAGYSPWGHKESDITEHACTLHIYYLLNEWINEWIISYYPYYGAFSLLYLCPLSVFLSWIFPFSIILSLEKKDFSLVPRSSWGYWFFLIPPSFILYIHVL